MTTMDVVLRLCRRAIMVILFSSSTSLSSASSSFNSNSHDESKCISVDSYATYVCTDNPGATIQAVASSSSIAGDDATTGLTIPAFAIDVGIEQKITGSESEQFKARNTLRKMVLYMENEVLIRSEYEHVRDKWYVQ